MPHQGLDSVCTPSEVPPQKMPIPLYAKRGIPQYPVPKIEHWKQNLQPWGVRPFVDDSNKVKKQKAHCRLKVKPFRKPSDKQKYLFVNDNERVGAVRTTYLDNGLLSEPLTGKTMQRHGYQPELSTMTHGRMPPRNEVGVAGCVGEWLVMPPSRDPKWDKLDFERLNKDSQRLELTTTKQFDVYKNCHPIYQGKRVGSGKLDRTIFFPKGVTFGVKSGPYDNLYEILSNKEQQEWVRERKAADVIKCEKIVQKLKEESKQQSNRAAEARYDFIHRKYVPPKETPRPLPGIRRRAQPKVSTHWDTDEVLTLLHDHPEFEERVKLFAVPAASNLLYHEEHQPHKLSHSIVRPPTPPTYASKYSECKQCGALECRCCIDDSEPPKGAFEEAQENVGDRSRVPKDKHVNDVGAGDEGRDLMADAYTTGEKDEPKGIEAEQERELVDKKVSPQDRKVRFQA